MKRTIVMICVGLMLMPGCNLYKKYEKDPSLENGVISNLSPLTSNLPTDTLSLGELNWRSLFTDPLLQDLISKAWANNTDMRTAQLTIEQAQNSVMSAKWGYAPTFSFTPSVTYDYQGNAHSYNVQLPVRASWQLGIFGQTRSKIRSAKAQLAYDEDYRQAVQVDLAANVANYYYNLVMLDRQLQISEETEQLYEESYNATVALYHAGIYKSPAVHEMQASLEALRADIVDLRYSIATNEASLCLLLSEAPHHIERSSFEAMSLPELSTFNLQLSTLSSRPDVRMAERNVEIAYYGKQQALQSFYPSISIDGMIAYAGSFNALGLLAEAVGSLAQPIFQGGQLVANLRNAKADQEKANLAFAYALYKAGSEVHNYKKACEAAGEKAGHIDIQVNALQEAYSATTALMNHGSTTYLEVLTAQESLLSAELSQVENRYEMIQALINLYTALGGFGE